ncbi:hypothetical protein [Hydrogenovibrio marinus]|uniref:Uncharacterized protein n=1 Tax=Hydrogenovibrio marinus TaxID=28885 RepID=A0A066ZWY4_HYDMR|nr:hypothetical protein [Hydrogenovibrio marinus]KDN94866.1 hypothetical protein EI16_00690 [Hydrogenovibrio marinus]BBN59327.1 hypothetical protein HVMH_0921 [Hydrogenovibrio marinus]
MIQETQQLIDAITSLKPESSFTKDYFFPIASAFFSSMLGAGIAYGTLKHQEYLQIEKDKLNIANKWMLNISDALSALIAIKANYIGKLKDDPIQRIACIKQAINIYKYFENDIHELSFIIPSSIEEQEQQNNKWSRIAKIQSMTANYNLALEVWKKRDELYEEFGNLLMAKHDNNAFAEITLKSAIEDTNQTIVAKLIEVNESAITMTDELIIQFLDFSKNFPAYAETKIDTKKLKRYGRIIRHQDQDIYTIAESLKERSPKVNLTEMNELLKKTQN